MRRCPLYIPEQKLNKSDRQRHPTIAMTGNPIDLSREYVDSTGCYGCGYLIVADFTIYGCYFCGAKRRVN